MLYGVLNQYLARLDKIYSRYDSSDYTAQDWNTLEALYHQATQETWSPPETKTPWSASAPMPSKPWPGCLPCPSGRKPF